ncbi:MAG: hypothetical protein ACI4QA_04630 [Candidatus Spyradosoma sp.]
MTEKESQTRFNFFRAGGVEQLSVADGNDFAAVEALDPKLWAALSMPTEGVDFDARTLALVDSDKDGRIRVPEIKAAVAFAREHFADFSSFFPGKTSFPLSALKKDSPLAPTAATLADADGNVSLDAARKAAADFAARPFNGDGLLTPASVEGDAVAALIADILAVRGGTPDDASVPAISPADADAFAADAASALAWREKAEADADAIFPLGDATADAFAAIEAVRAKAEDFFARCRLAAYEPANADRLNASADDIAGLAQDALTADASAAFPLARVAAAAGVPALPLENGVNPAWADALRALRDAALVPALELPAKTESMTETQWRGLLAKFSAHAAWTAAKPQGKIADLPVARLREIAGTDVAAALAPLFARDAAEAPTRRALEDVERLCLYSGHLTSLLRNYVSFADFYALSPDTIFLAGRLFIDGRECALCVRVKDAASHAALAAKSECFIAYCRCARKSDGATMTIAAVLGDGDADFLSVGRNGVFVDKSGNDWDATVEKILEQPISLRQAVWAPYRKLVRFIETQVANFAAAREKKVDADLSGGVGKVATTAGAPAAGTAAKPAFDIGKFVGIFAAIGLALGAIGAAVAALGSAFLALPWWQMPLAILGLLVLISAPSVVITAMKLRRRSLAPILDANSWAVNARAKINIALGKAYTKMPCRPKSSRFVGDDPYASGCGKTRGIVVVLLALIVVGLVAGVLLKRRLDADAAAAEAEAVPAQTETAAAAPAEQQ